MKSISVLCMVLCSIFASAGETTLYSFQGGSDGSYPATGLLMDQTGNLYGTTSNSVFELSPNGQGGWIKTTLADVTDNGFYVAPILDTEGNLYGVSAQTVYELSPGQSGWTFAALHVFTSTVSGLGIDEAGNIYGTTELGGRLGGGTVFRLSNSDGKWTFKTLHAFEANGAAGRDPRGSLVVAQDGTIYGVASFGGGYSNGVFYSLSPGNWEERVLFSFRGKSRNEGGPIFGLSADQKGNLYCVYGGAFTDDENILEFSMNSKGVWIHKGIYTFHQSNDGWAPTGTLFIDQNGNAYGTTVEGHGGRGDITGGTVYELTPNTVGFWTETILYTFPLRFSPRGHLVRDNAGNLYGTTEAGGDSNFGTVFEVAP